jgi:chromosomal replication initiator protein
LPLDVAEFLATQVGENVRELEGALLRTLSLTTLTRAPLDLATARHALHDITDDGSRTGSVGIPEIVCAVQDFYRIRPRDFLSRSKVRSIVYARQVGMFLARQLTHLSLQEIGLHFGGRDHTTVLYAEGRISRLRKSHPQLRADLQTLKTRILSSHHS